MSTNYFCSPFSERVRRQSKSLLIILKRYSIQGTKCWLPIPWQVLEWSIRYPSSYKKSFQIWATSWLWEVWKNGDIPIFYRRVMYHSCSYHTFKKYTRFSIPFSNNGVVYSLYNHLVNFFDEIKSDKRLVIAVYWDLKVLALRVGQFVLELVEKLVTGLLSKVKEKEKYVIKMPTHYQKLLSCFKKSTEGSNSCWTIKHFTIFFVLQDIFSIPQTSQFPVKKTKWSKNVWI